MVSEQARFSSLFATFIIYSIYFLFATFTAALFPKFIPCEQGVNRLRFHFFVCMNETLACLSVFPVGEVTSLFPFFELERGL